MTQPSGPRRSESRRASPSTTGAPPRRQTVPLAGPLPGRVRQRSEYGRVDRSRRHEGGPRGAEHRKSRSPNVYRARGTEPGRGTIAVTGPTVPCRRRPPGAGHHERTSTARRRARQAGRAGHTGGPARRRPGPCPQRHRACGARRRRGGHLLRSPAPVPARLGADARRSAARAMADAASAGDAPLHRRDALWAAVCNIAVARRNGDGGAVHKHWYAAMEVLAGIPSTSSRSFPLASCGSPQHGCARSTGCSTHWTRRSHSSTRWGIRCCGRCPCIGRACTPEFSPTRRSRLRRTATR